MRKLVFHIFSQCKIHYNSGYSVQVHTNGATATFISTLLLEQGTLHFYVASDGKVSCQNCKFEASNDPHCDVCEGGQLSLEGCDISVAQRGIGLQVHNNGFVTFSNSKIHHLDKFGVMIGSAGKLEASNATIMDCKVGALYIQSGGQVVLTSCNLVSNGDYTIQIDGGSEHVGISTPVLRI